MIIQSWTNVVVGSLQNLWWGSMALIPNILAASVVMIVGFVVAAGVGALAEKIFEGIRIDPFLEKIGLKPIFDRAGLRIRVAYFIGRVVSWSLVIAFLLAVSDSLGLYALSGFLSAILGYLPNLISAIFIMLAALVLAHFLRRVVIASVMSAKLHSGPFLGMVTWWVITVFGFLTALAQLNIATAIVQTIVTGFIAMLALAGGLAFGLGGRDYAAHLLNKLKDRTENH